MCAPLHTSVLSEKVDVCDTAHIHFFIKNRCVRQCTHPFFVDDDWESNTNMSILFGGSESRTVSSSSSGNGPQAPCSQQQQQRQRQWSAAAAVGNGDVMTLLETDRGQFPLLVPSVVPVFWKITSVPRSRGT